MNVHYYYVKLSKLKLLNFDHKHQARYFYHFDHYNQIRHFCLIDHKHQACHFYNIDHNHQTSHFHHIDHNQLLFKFGLCFVEGWGPMSMTFTCLYWT